MELNPNHAATQQLHDHWHKMVAILLHRYGDVVITLEEIHAMPVDVAVVFQELNDGLHLSLIDGPAAMELARREGGLPS